MCKMHVNAKVKLHHGTFSRPKLIWTIDDDDDDDDDDDTSVFDEIPSYEMPILIGTAGISAIGLVYIVKKRI